MIVYNVLDYIEFFDIDKLTELLTSKLFDADKPSSYYIPDILWNIDMHPMISKLSLE
jgi:hypothetical protein